MMFSSKKFISMKPFSLLAAVLLVSVTLFATSAEARRMGGARSSGMQRSTAINKNPSAPQQKPAPAPAAAKTATPGTATAAPKRSWMGPLAGLAAGLGLAALASHLGLGEGFANVLMIALLAMAAMALFGFITRKRAAASAGGMAYAGAMGNPHSSTMQHQPAPSAMAGGSLIGSALAGSQQIATHHHWPADFDTDSFVRSAKVNFIRLQAANDAGNLDDLRQFTSPEMFAELQMDLAERGGATQHTEVVRLDAEVLEVVEESNSHIASVHFHGLIREDRQEAAEFSEIWHLVRPTRGGTWIVAGIQQPQ